MTIKNIFAILASKVEASTTDGAKGGRERTKGTFGQAQPTKAKNNGCLNLENRIIQHGTVTGYQTKAPYTEKAFQVFFRENHLPKGKYNDFALTKSTKKSLFCIASGKGKFMQKYFDWNSEKVITEEEVKLCYDAFADKEYETFERYLECCQDYNNGSLTRLEIMISRLESRLRKYRKIQDDDSTKELELQIAQLKKEL